MRWLAEIARERATLLPTTEPKDVNRLTRFLDTHVVLIFTMARNGTMCIRWSATKSNPS
jgi:hypothetical protein